MRIIKNNTILKLVNSYLIDASQPSNISYLWNFGSLLAICLGIQIITGVTLAMHYTPSVLEAFNSVEHIMRDVNNGWLVRYLHSNTASAFFFLVYLHVARGMYYGSYRSPRTLVWTIGVIIFILMMAIGFLGYVIPYGQMSLWGATVITNLISAIPWIGQDIVEFIWGGFSVNNATVNRFFALHFILPFVLAALVLMHLIALHDTAGSGNPVGVAGTYDRVPFAPYFLFKDLITIFIFIFVLSFFVFFMPNALGDSENYIMANPMQTPAAIVPEWYLLPFYAILRSIPNKLLGVITMFGALLILLILPFVDLGRSRGFQFRPLSKLIFYIFIVDFLSLGYLGAKHVEDPYVIIGQVCAILYFTHFIFTLPITSVVENTLMDIAYSSKEIKKEINKSQNTFNSNSNNPFLNQKRNFTSTFNSNLNNPFLNQQKRNFGGGGGIGSGSCSSNSSSENLANTLLQELIQPVLDANPDTAMIQTTATLLILNFIMQGLTGVLGDSIIAFISTTDPAIVYQRPTNPQVLALMTNIRELPFDLIHLNWQITNFHTLLNSMNLSDEATRQQVQTLTTSFLQQRESVTNLPNIINPVMELMTSSPEVIRQFTPNYLEASNELLSHYNQGIDGLLSLLDNPRLRDSQSRDLITDTLNWYSRPYIIAKALFLGILELLKNWVLRTFPQLRL